MELDEAIRHCEEVAEENQAIVDACDYYGDNMAKCDECAKEHRQLARWLRELKALKEQVNGDCISREAVIKSLHKRFADGFDSDKWWNSTSVLCAVYGAPSVIPLTTPQPKAESQPKTGHWIEHKGTFKPHIECSECGIWFLKADLPRKSYCPNCGSCNGDMIKNIMKDIANNKRRQE